MAGQKIFAQKLYFAESERESAHENSYFWALIWKLYVSYMYLSVKNQTNQS